MDGSAGHCFVLLDLPCESLYRRVDVVNNSGELGAIKSPNSQLEPQTSMLTAELHSHTAFFQGVKNELQALLTSCQLFLPHARKIEPVITGLGGISTAASPESTATGGRYRLSFDVFFLRCLLALRHVFGKNSASLSEQKM